MRTTAMLIGFACLLASGAIARTSDHDGETVLAKALKGYTPGKQVSCIRLLDTRDQQVIDSTAILYRAAGNKTIYVNRPNGAQFLDDNSFQIVKPFNDELCRLDIVEQRDRSTHMPNGSISLNSFDVYTKIP